MTQTTDEEDDKSSQPMPEDVWKTLYAKRGNKVVPIVNFDELTINRSYGKVDNWGRLVQACVNKSIDLSGLTLSDEQKRYDYQHELRGKNLVEGKLSSCNLEDFDLSNTGFTGANLEHANLRHTTGNKPCFNKVTGKHIDFSSARYDSPNFKEMYVPHIIHNDAVYDAPSFLNTDWSHARMVRTSLKNVQIDTKTSTALTLDDALIAGTSFIANGPITDLKIKGKNIEFLGCCFHGIRVTIASPYLSSPEFSQISLTDTRLTEAEREFISKKTQWTDSDIQEIAIDPQNSPLHYNDSVLLPLYSNSRIDTSNKTIDITSVGEAIHRKNYYECTKASFIEIFSHLSDHVKDVSSTHNSLAVLGPQTYQPLSLPDLSQVTQDIIQQDVTALQQADTATLLSAGLSLQTLFARASAELATHAVGQLAHTSKLGKIITDLRALLQDDNLEDLLNPETEDDRTGLLSRVWDNLRGKSKDKKVVSEISSDTQFERIQQILERIPHVIEEERRYVLEQVSGFENAGYFLGALGEGIDEYKTQLSKRSGLITQGDQLKTSVLEEKKNNLALTHMVLQREKLATDLSLATSISLAQNINTIETTTVPLLNMRVAEMARLHQCATMSHLGEDTKMLTRGLMEHFGMDNLDPTDPQAIQEHMNKRFQQELNGLLKTIETTAQELQTSNQAQKEAISGIVASSKQQPTQALD